MQNRTRAAARPSTPAPAPARDSATSDGTSAQALRGPLPILAVAILWGTTGTASSLAPAGASPVSIGAAALLLGGLLLFLADSGARSLPRRCSPHERWLLLAGAVTVAAYPLSFYPAVARTGVAVSTVIALGSAPVFAGLLGLLARGPRPSGRWIRATLLAVVGCAVLVLGPELAGGRAPVDLVGVALAACAGLVYAAYSLVGGRLIGHGRASGAVMGAMFAGGALLVLPLLLTRDLHWLASPRGVAVLGHLGVLTTFLAYRLFGYGLRHTTAQVATTLTLAEPAVAALLGVVVLGERLPSASWCGLGVLALGLAVLVLPARAGRRVVVDSVHKRS